MSDDGGRWNPDERVQELEQQARREEEVARKQAADKERRQAEERRDKDHTRAASSSSSSHSRDRSRERSSSHHRRSSRSRSRSRDRDRERKAAAQEPDAQQMREWEQLAAVRERGVRRSRTRSRSPQREQSKQQQQQQPQRPAHRSNASSISAAAASTAFTPAAAAPSRPPVSRIDCRNPSTNVMLHSLPPLAVESDIVAALESFFPDHPPPLQVRLIRHNGISKCYAFAEYASIEQAVAVMEMAAGLAASGARQFEVAGATVGLSFGTQKEGHSAADKAAAMHRQAEAAAAAAALSAAMTPWQCSRCGTENDGRLACCSICNIARAVLEGGEAATIAMSESLTSANTQKAYRAQQMHLAAMQPVIAAAAAAAASALAPAVDPMDSSLLEHITSGTVLLLSGLSASSTPTSIRDALLPFAAVVDVKLALDEAGSPLLPPLAMVELDSKEDVECLQSKAGALRIEGATPTMIVASSKDHAKLARAGRSISWAKQQDRTAHPVATSANAPVAMGSLRSAPQLPLSVRPPGLAPSFQWDGSSGYYFDATSGYYFDAATSLYFHAATHTYSKWDALTGSYVTTDQAGNLVAAATPLQHSGLSAEAAQYLALKTAQALEKQRALEGPNAHPPPLETAAPISFGMKSVARKLAAAAASAAFAPPAAAAAAPAAAVPAAASASSSSSFLDISRLACLLCNRQLKSVEQLLKHEQLSELHKTNLAAHHAKINGATAAAPAATSAATARPAAAAPAPTAAATPPKSAAELEYLRAMAVHKQLDRDPNAKHAMLK